ncbi:hypothetical protein CK203_041847 [Vitis vinifera]|uniref:C-JID domain-containing protein n=1 Tax=Vitis vinifera TaxID=29760 RepID=A0A438FYC7_VITVI|nr:hypothetical protein CK203_041847 [Vitis vinifera]
MDLVFVVQQYPNIQVPFSTVFPGRTIPDWFMHHSKGHEVDVEVAPNWYDSNFLGFAVSAVIAPKDGSIKKGWSTYCDLDSHDPDLEFKYSRECSFTNAHTSQLEDTTITFSFSTNRKSCIVKRCGVCPVYMEGDGSNEGFGIPQSGEALAQARPRESVHEDVNNSVSQDTIIRSFHEAEPRGIGYSPTNSHVWYQERPWMPPNPDHYVRERNPAGGSVLDDHHEGILEDTIIRRRSLHQAYSSGIGYSPTDSHAWDQERLGRQPNHSISNSETGIWVFIIILASCFWLTFSFGLAEVMLNILHV